MERTKHETKLSGSSVDVAATEEPVAMVRRLWQHGGQHVAEVVRMSAINKNEWQDADERQQRRCGGYGRVALSCIRQKTGMRVELGRYGIMR